MSQSPSLSLTHLIGLVFGMQQDSSLEEEWHKHLINKWIICVVEEQWVLLPSVTQMTYCLNLCPVLHMSLLHDFSFSLFCGIMRGEKSSQTGLPQDWLVLLRFPLTFFIIRLDGWWREKGVPMSPQHKRHRCEFKLCLPIYDAQSKW